MRPGWCLSILTFGDGPSQESAAPPPPPPPLVAATFHPWYDSPGAHFVDDEGRDLLRHHFVAPDLVHPDSVEWYERELADAAAAGIDVLLVGSVVEPDGTSRWMAPLRQALERTAGSLERPVRVALLLDPWSIALARARRDAPAGSASPPRVAKLDLTDPSAFAAFVAPVDQFFAAFPEPLRAQIDGAPLLVVDHDAAVAARPDDLFERLARQVEALPGVSGEPELVVERSWKRAELRMWRAGSGLLGTQVAGDVATVSPGFDGRIADGQGALIRLREEGENYAVQWARVLAAKPRLAIVESWNQMHDGTAICVALEHGRKYVEATRVFGDSLRAGAVGSVVPALRHPDPILASAYAEGRVHALADVVSFDVGREDGGISIAPRGMRNAALTFGRASDGELWLRIATAGEGTGAVVRFDVAASFLDPGPTEYELELCASARDGEIVCGVLHDEKAAPLVFSFVESARVVKSVRFTANGSGPRSLEFTIPARSRALHVRSLRLRRRSRTLPECGLGLSNPASLAQLDAGSMERARELRARWLRIEARWSELEPVSEAIDVSKLAEVVRGARAAGLEPIVALDEAPAWARPVAAHADEVGRITKAIAFGCPELRLLELFPGANVPGVLSRFPDAHGYVRVLRAAAREAHAANPHLALVAGSVEGPDANWIRTIQELREPFAYDAIALRASDESGEPSSRTFARQLARIEELLAKSPDANKPFFVEVGTTSGTSPLLAPERSELLPALIAAAWRRLERDATPVHVLDAPELPRVRGLAVESAKRLLEGGGMEVATRTLRELVGDLDDARVRTLLLPNGEIAPSELLPRLPRFLDGGGLLVTLGGAPFRRSATEHLSGWFQLDDNATPALTLRDELRIALAAYRPGIDPDPPAREWKAALIAPELDRFEPTPRDGALFTARTGQPLDPRGYHRYDALITTAVDGRPIGDVAALVAFSGARTGAVLLVGVDAQDHGLDAPGQAKALRDAFQAADAVRARAFFWSGRFDEDDASTRAFAELAGADRADQK